MNRICFGTYARSDAELTEEVARVLAAPALRAHLEPVGFSVLDGVVTLTGSIATEAQRRFAVRVVCSVEGVAGVEDHLSIRETGSVAVGR